MAELDGIFSTREALFRKDATPEQSRMNPHNPPETTYHSYVNDFFSARETTLVHSRGETKAPFLTNEGAMASLFEDDTEQPPEVSEFVLDNIFKKKEDKTSSVREKPILTTYPETMSGLLDDIPGKDPILKLRKISFDNSAPPAEHSIFRESQDNNSTPVLSPTEDSSDLSLEFQSKLLLEPIEATPSISKTISHLSAISLPQSDTKRTSVLTIPDTTVSTPSDKPNGLYARRTSSIMKWKRASRVGLGPPKRFRLEDALNEMDEEPADEQSNNVRESTKPHPFNDLAFNENSVPQEKEQIIPKPGLRSPESSNNGHHSPTRNEEYKPASKPRLLPRPYMDRNQKNVKKESSPELLPRPSEILPKPAAPVPKVSSL
ncbi:hypothetical protein K493DRAFT_37597 [Basidiobolus meristosporus CBS 931.73]|uniref:Uncharacterized protein n=1 Tax=Basidiobolus meristosporus CBS 931.73 TaxID=1314790 RepID=A0A1Y1Y5M5_9FUNG|nr:hypothetical protein K493DRAFT_37597 [Basidiobolus meristosporus CBS 931.73]|eukprot:ORX93259.1 hypothetical protein K493DRAFT_37597 [Basidiobolus meristosporus CBS 931.73]